MHISHLQNAKLVFQTGKLNVYAGDPGEASHSLKHVKPGDSIMSLLSFLDHLSGKSKPYKTVSAKAIADTKVIKLPFGAFRVAFEKYPDAYLRVVQVVMIRLQVVCRGSTCGDWTNDGSSFCSSESAKIL